MVQAIRESNIEVNSPIDLRKIGEVRVSSPEEIKAAVERGRKAFEVWRNLDFGARARVLLAARDAFVRRKEELIQLICLENGKPRVEALVEVTYVCDIITFYARNGRKFLRRRKITPHLLRTKKVSVHYEPRGVIGMITPWNFPLILTIGEAIPALLAGNAVVIKPSEWTPLSARLGGEIIREALIDAGLPEDVLQIVFGFGPAGGAIVDTADMIAFTGSVKTGKMIAERAASRLVPVALELGGKDPMVVLRDADIERAANAAVWGAFMNSGQVCISVERVYVDEAIADDFTRRVVEKTRKLRQGTDFDQRSTDNRIDVGAMTYPRQVETVEDHIRDAVEKGAKVAAGGKRNAGLPGRYFEPTVLTDVNHSMKVMTEETFGPILPIMKVKGAEEALRLANDSIYGLNASVWTRNSAEGEAIASRVEAGITCVNDVVMGFGITDAPSGGIKESGIGKRHGHEGIQRFCHEQVIVTDRFNMKREVVWYPYSAGTERMLSRVVGLLFSSRLSAKLGSLFKSQKG